MRAWIAGDDSSAVVYEVGGALAVVVREPAEPRCGRRAAAAGTRSPSGRRSRRARCARRRARWRPCAVAWCARWARSRARAAAGRRPPRRRRAARARSRRPRAPRSRRCARPRAAPARGCCSKMRTPRCLDRAREGPHPARRVHGRVRRREHADAAGPAHDRGQIGLVDPFGRQVVGAHRLVLDARVLELLRLPRDPQAAHVREVLRCADLLGDLVDPLLRGQRGAVDAERDVVPEQPDRVLVGRRGARHEESAVAAARSARRRARLDDRAVDAALGQVPGAGEAGDAGADHEHVGLAVAGERGALLVGIVVPEREQRGHAQDRKRFELHERECWASAKRVANAAAYTGGASDAPSHARILGGTVATASRERHPGGHGAERPASERHLRIRRRRARLREPPGRRQARPARGRPAAAHDQPAAAHGGLVLDPARGLSGRQVPLPLLRGRLPGRGRRQRDRARARRRPRQDLPHAHAPRGLDDTDDPRVAARRDAHRRRARHRHPRLRADPARAAARAGAALAARIRVVLGRREPDGHGDHRDVHPARRHHHRAAAPHRRQGVRRARTPGLHDPAQSAPVRPHRLPHRSCSAGSAASAPRRPSSRPSASRARCATRCS